MREQWMRDGQGFLLVELFFIPSMIMKFIISFSFYKVYNITSRASLESLPALRERILRVKDVGSIPMVVVGNKIDLEQERVVTFAEVGSVCVCVCVHVCLRVHMVVVGNTVDL